MDLKIALGLLVALMCVPSGWSYVRDRKAEAEKEFYEYDDGWFWPQPPILPSPGFHSAKLARIVGGDELPKHKYPFLALIYTSVRYWWKPSCGGSILDPRNVLTAGHCVKDKMPEDLKVMAGEHDYRKVEGKEQLVNVQKIFLHPSYNETLLNDVAVLRLATPLEFNKAVSSVQLNSNDTCPTVAQTCTTAGWGRTSYPYGKASPVPRYIQVPVAKPDTCKRIYGRSFGEDQLCIGGLGKEVCRGDSGGPMVCNCGGRQVVGITSYGVPCGIYGYPSAYTKVSYFYDWITEQTRK